MEVGINVEGGIFWKKLVHKCNKRGVEGGNILEINKRGGGIFFLWRGEFFKIGKRGLHFIKKMRIKISISICKLRVYLVYLQKMHIINGLVYSPKISVVTLICGMQVKSYVTKMQQIMCEGKY